MTHSEEDPLQALAEEDQARALERSQAQRNGARREKSLKRRNKRRRQGR